MRSFGWVIVVVVIATTISAEWGKNVSAVIGAVIGATASICYFIGRAGATPSIGPADLKEGA